MAGLLGGFFNFVDPILDTIDPLHNKVQTWTTGSSTTEGQSPYFQAIAPMVVDYFLPGVGSAIAAADGASTGNWGKAAIGAMGAAGQLGSLGSTAAEGANGGLAATEATSGLNSTGGVAAGEVASAAPVDYSTAYSANTYGDGFDSAGLLNSNANASTFDASNFAAQNNFGQTPVNDIGYQGMSAPNYSTIGTQQFMTIPTSQYSTAAGVGGAGQGLEATSSAAAANSTLAGKGVSYGKLAENVGKLYVQQMSEQEKAARERAMMQQMNARAAMGGGDAGAQTGRPAQSFQTLSPYAKFNGGFNPRPYGSNVRNRGLLG